MTRARALATRIRRGARAHYEDADYYDYTYRGRRADVRFYAELAEEHKGPVLELGCGSGRVTLEIARRGLEVVGVDLSTAMLRAARAKEKQLKASARGRCKFLKADLRKLRLGRRFPLVIAPFNVLMHLYELRDIEAMLETVRQHLAPDGRFVFDASMPDLGAMTRRPTRLYRGPRLTHPRSGKRYHYLEAFEYDAVRQVQMVSMIFQNEADMNEMTILPLSQRQFFPQELRALLHYNGFEVEACFGDFRKGPLEPNSETQLVIARLRPKAPRRRSPGARADRPSASVPPRARARSDRSSKRGGRA